MSANDNIIADLNVNTSNSNKTDSGEINAVITRIDDASSNPGECIFANKPQNATEVVQLNYEQNMQDAMAVIHKLQTGLDVNVRFNSVSEFEYTPECIIFDLLGISLYHGWLVDPQNQSEVTAIGHKGVQNHQLVTEGRSQRGSESQQLVTEERSQSGTENHQLVTEVRSQRGSESQQLVTEGRSQRCSESQQLVTEGRLQKGSESQQLVTEGRSQRSSEGQQQVTEGRSQRSSESQQLVTEGRSQRSSENHQLVTEGRSQRSSENHQLVTEGRSQRGSESQQLVTEGRSQRSSENHQLVTEGRSQRGSESQQLVTEERSQSGTENHQLVTEALVAEGFLDRTASQLTYHGLCELSSTLKPDQLCVFFRNNHFCTLYRQKDELFLLVTDQGFLHERNVVWETLNNVEGDHYFVDSEFHTYTKPTPQEPVLPPDVSVNSDEQVNHDFLLAMSLQQEQQLCAEQMEVAEAPQQQPQHQRTHLSDAEFAARLQAEEDAQAAQQAAQPPAQPHGNQRVPPGGSQQRSRDRERPRDRERHRERSREKDSSCCIL
ncbi:MINDY1_2 [Mytilus edulis]|uniref:Ubiquitin carboxyl-terminal hydrolase n=1 Tax=Mytilus edulis TaxID=6550 RepID=A0A8S3RZD2_MYTED|nr:MINDY1_2 [Mytilus edulis]